MGKACPDDQLVGDSRAMRQVRLMIEAVAPTPHTVLISGETGTGKDVAAHLIHALSERKNGEFVKIDCGGLAGTLIEAELFGYDRGAFTGATVAHPGPFERAAGGTVFLDEVAELPLELQSRLLRVLQDRLVERVGGRGTIAVDVRVVAATSTDLRQLVAAGRFRLDLLHRLDVLRLHMPPLREHREDILALLRCALAKGGYGGTMPGEPCTELLRRMSDYDWPGNVRELENEVLRAVMFGAAGRVGESLPHASDSESGRPDCPDTKYELGAAPRVASVGLEQDAGGSERMVTPVRPSVLPLDEVVRAEVAAALDQAHGIVSAAARLLGISRGRLLKLMRRQGIEGARVPPRRPSRRPS